MGVLVLITFLGANLQAVLWQSSSWLVSTVLPAVVVDLTNEERSHNNARPLQRNAVLDAAAQLKAEDMAKNEYFAHFSPTGVSPWHWFDEADYVYAHAGENLAIHFTDSSEVVEAWMNSPLHRKNIVDGKFTEIGVGTAKGEYEGYETVYVVQLFGTPAVAPTPASKSQPASVAVEDVAEAPAPVATKAALEPIAVATETVAAAEISTEAAEVALDQVTTQVPALAADTSAPENSEETILKAAEPSEQPVILEQTESPDVVVIESSMIATSSGLAIAHVVSPNPPSHPGTTAASIMTQPNVLLQYIYMILAAVVLLLLGASVIQEAKRLHYMQVAYGVLLLVGMGGLWFAHSLLTEGAVVV